MVDYGSIRMRLIELGGAQSKMLQTITRMHERRKDPCINKTVVTTSPVDSYEDSSTATLPPLTKRRTTKVVRRREPTIDIRLLTAQHTHSEDTSNTVLGGFSTLEVKSDHTLKSHYTTEKEDTESALCGWRTDEHFKVRRELDNYATQQYITERGQLHSREKSSRLYSCRLNSRISRKRTQYAFAHYDSKEGHMQHYIETCSFSHLVITSKKPSNGDILEHQPDCIQEITDQCNERPHDSTNNHTAINRSAANNYNKSQSITKDKTGPYKLHSLATRLGVMESIREQHMLHSATNNSTAAGTSRPTPPSIVKKRAGVSKETQEELLVCGPQIQRDHNNSR